MGALEKVIKTLEREVRENIGELGDYEVYNSHGDYFKPLKDDVEPRLMAFVDGGNNTILEAPRFSLQVNRVYFNLFRGKKRQRPSRVPEKIEFFSYLSVHDSEDGQVGKVKIFPLLEEHRKYLPVEEDLTVTLPGPPDFYQRSRMFSVARRFAEWSFSTHIIEEELDEGDILVKDGSLDTSFEGERKYLHRILETADRMGVNLAGLSKTCTLPTPAGDSLIASIGRLAKDINYKRWYYPTKPTKKVKEYNIKIMIVKLHELSDYIFRLDLLNQDDELEIISAIGENTVDATFPGYPYGLIDADLNARVRMDEVNIYKTSILSGLSGDTLEELKYHIRALDAHERLNMIAMIKDKKPR
ncbi:hypothetical protein MTTB_09810 [Methanothermobacter tenebrarum]|uniref:NurA domain-containing protein n=1 Tax=Methanothermobacter tenebrarum TaxID=680118 RepID=A0ABN6PBI3_9EURY|nr:hypothetical protein MTTB_09810 [Methanothermobacter tenebrarum]